MFAGAVVPQARKDAGGDWDRLAYAVARGRAEALSAVDAMDIEDAFMWLHFAHEQHQAEQRALKRRG
jgi:hypothetical protein